jgi:hypothetical protein
MQQSVQSNTSRTIQAGMTQMRAAYSVCNMVDDQGREIQITEAMILAACASLKQRCCNQAAA